MTELPENLRNAPWIMLGESLQQADKVAKSRRAEVLALQSIAASLALLAGNHSDEKRDADDAEVSETL